MPGAQDKDFSEPPRKSHAACGAEVFPSPDSGFAHPQKIGQLELYELPRLRVGQASWASLMQTTRRPNMARLRFELALNKPS